jgi:hypothetical protein
VEKDITKKSAYSESDKGIQRGRVDIWWDQCKEEVRRTYRSEGFHEMSCLRYMRLQAIKSASMEVGDLTNELIAGVDGNKNPKICLERPACSSYLAAFSTLSS